MQATFNQRRALFNMRRALKWDLVGIRDMTFEEASEAIKECKEEFIRRGFETSNEEE
jgi:hypothetical protein